MEIVHGYWEDYSNGWMCSVCNRDNRYDEDICPHCGAIMDLKYEDAMPPEDKKRKWRRFRYEENNRYGKTRDFP